MEKLYLQYLVSRPSSEGWSPPSLERQYPQPSETRGANVDRIDARYWAGSVRKRLFDFVFAFIALILTSPVMLAAAIAVKLSSRGPILFRQSRVGKDGEEFVIYKFRTMRIEQHSAAPSVTRSGDTRLTPLGAALRRLKIDELPQLYNVLKGDMSLVGSRPKVPRHQIYPLKFRPGITGAASLAFRDEETMLHRVAEDALDDYQIHVLMPLKMHIDRSYLENATFWSDLKIILATALGSGQRLDDDGLQRFQRSLISLDSALRTRFAVAAHAPSQPCPAGLQVDAA